MGFIASIKKLFGPGVDLGEIIGSGAKIIDVRTPGEFAGGNVRGSINIPLNTLSSKLGKFKKDEALVTCCASGMRSRSAKALLQSNGFTKVYNGGSWYSLTKYKR
ncbi:MAG TPA: rhodanese-like domain-containing protein [Mucilaginibacter sp.]|jgi:rhodanese-related sulfurtransferase|nr:rhodanese-like domain-containing protein [Mucilaginibacter sp.]